MQRRLTRSNACRKRERPLIQEHASLSFSRAATGTKRIAWNDASLLPRRRRGTGNAPLSLLTKNEGILLSLIDGKTCLPDLLRLPYLDSGAVREAFASLVRKRLLGFVFNKGVVAERRLRKRLEKETMILEQEIISSGDHFSLFGVFPRSSLSHLRHAYYRKMKIFLDNRFEKFRSLQRRRVLLSAKLRHAYEALSVPGARRTYVDSLLKPTSSASGVSDKAEHKFREGLYWWERGYVAERLAFLESARLTYAENLKFWLYAAKAMMPMPELVKQAMDYFEHVIERDHVRVEAHLGLAELCCREGAWERAASSLLRASEIDPSHPDVWRLGRLLKRA